MDNKKIKVLIGDDSAEYGITCANELRALGLYVVTRRKDGKVILDAIRNDTPDVVVMDAVLPGMDAIEILEKSQTFAHAPAFIITSSYENTFIERQVMEKGAAYFMLMLSSAAANARATLERPDPGGPQISHDCAMAFGSPLAMAFSCSTTCAWPTMEFHTLMRYPRQRCSRPLFPLK